MVPSDVSECEAFLIDSIGIQGSLVDIDFVAVCLVVYNGLVQHLLYDEKASPYICKD